MAHLVKCVYCKRQFNRDKWPYVQVSTQRYAHKECSIRQDELLSKEEKDKIELEKYILKLLNEDYISPRVRKQLNQYVNEYHYTYSGIHKSLYYFYEIQKNPVEKANGSIGIVPYIYKASYDYYYSLWLAQQNNKDKVVQEYIPTEKTIKIPNPQKKIRKRKLFSFLDE